MTNIILGIAFWLCGSVSMYILVKICYLRTSKSIVSDWTCGDRMQWIVVVLCCSILIMPALLLNNRALANAKKASW